MLKFQVLKLLMEGLVLADFALVELFLQDTHATGDARRVVAAAVLAIYVEFVDQLIALGAVVLLLLLAVIWSMSGEQVDGKELVGLSFSLTDCVQSLKFDQRSRTFSETSIEEGRNGDQTVDILGLQLFLIFNQSHSSFHGTVVVFLVQLSLAKKVEMNGFSSFPWIGKGFVSG